MPLTTSDNQVGEIRWLIFIKTSWELMINYVQAVSSFNC